MLKHLCVDQAEEQRMMTLDTSFAKEKDHKYCIK